MRYKILILTVAVLALCLSSAFAGSDKKLGTAGAQELRIPIGSRGTAMGGAVVANTYGLEAVYWNPAGVALTDGTEAMFSYLPYLADIDVNFGGIATSIEGFGTIAAAAKVVSIGDIEQTTVNAPEGNGKVFNPTLAVIGVTYARYLTSNTTFGFTANLITENLFEVNATGVSFDFGVMYDPRWNGVKLGVAIKNIGPDMRFDGAGFERPTDPDNPELVAPRNATFELPANINIGLSYDFINQDKNRAQLSGNFRSNNFSQDQWQGGFEYAYDETYFLRAGYNYADQDNYIYGLSLGAGLVYSLGETTISLEYAWNETDFFDDNQFFTVKLNF